MSDLCHIEIVDRNDNPVPQGQYGEKILVTNLFNFVQPIIRYEIEDVTGYANQNCECGYPFPTLMPVRGRATDFLYFKKPGGEYERFYPYIPQVPLFHVSDLRQYQIAQTVRNELTVFYVAQKNAVAIEQQLIHPLEEALARKGLESQVTLKLKRVQSIPRDERTGKFKIIKSLGPPADLDTGPETTIFS